MATRLLRGQCVCARSVRRVCANLLYPWPHVAGRHFHAFSSGHTAKSNLRRTYNWQRARRKLRITFKTCMCPCSWRTIPKNNPQTVGTGAATDCRPHRTTAPRPAHLKPNSNQTTLLRVLPPAHAQSCTADVPMRTTNAQLRTTDGNSQFCAADV